MIGDRNSSDQNVGARCVDDSVAAAFVDGGLAPALRGRVEQHLDRCEDCRLHISRLARVHTRRDGDATTGATTGADTLALPLRPGDSLGRYSLRKKLASGGMGVVWLAHDPQLDRVVALKVPRAGNDDEGMVRRLEREARALARLRDERIVEVYDVGVSDGRRYFAMPYIAGGTLACWAEPRRPDRWREICNACIEAGRALAHAHGAGLLHRDIKPTNVMVGDDGRVFVTDFGISTALSSPRGEHQGTRTASLGRATRSGSVVGTAGYLAPEVRAGHGPSERSEQFALAVTIHEVLYGRRPRSDVSADRLVAAPGASSRAPRAVARVLTRAMSTDADERFATLTKLLDALERAVERPTRVRWMAAIGVVTIAAAAAVVGPFVGQPTAPLETAPRAAPRATILGIEAALERGHQARARGATAAAGEAADEAMALAEAADDDLARARSLILRGSVDSDLGNAREARAALRTASALAESEGDNELSGTAHLLSIKVLANGLGQPHEALAVEPFVRAAIARMGGSPELEQRLDESLGQTYALLRQPQRARAHLERARELAAAHGLPQANVLTSLGNVSMLEADYVAAEALFRRAAAHVESRRDPDPVENATALNNVAGALAARGQWPRALGQSRRALELQLTVLDDDHPAVCSSRLLIGQILLAQGQPHAAADILAQVVEARRSRLPADHPELADAVYMRAEAMLQLGALDDSDRLYTRALVAYEGATGTEDPRVVFCLAGLAASRIQRGALEEAQALLDRADSIARELALAGGRVSSTVLAERAALALKRGRLVEAEAAYRKSIALRDADLEAPVPGIAPQMRGLAKIRLARGDAQTAKAILRRALGVLDRAEVGGREWAQTAFVLAKASSAGGRNGNEAASLARRAREAAVGSLGADAGLVREIDAWLSRRRGRR